MEKLKQKTKQNTKKISSQYNPHKYCTKCYSGRQIHTQYYIYVLDTTATMIKTIILRERFENEVLNRNYTEI